MGIAYSRKPIFHGAIRCDTSAHLRGDLDAALTVVGWLHSSTVTNGFIYEITSPQAGANLKAHVLIQDKGGVGFGGPYIVIQFMSEDETAVGTEHRLIFANGAYYSLGYQMIAGKSQMFLSLPGINGQQVTLGDFSYSVAGGIPYVAAPVGDSCTSVVKNQVVTDIWWSCGSGQGPFTVSRDFRVGGNCFGNWSSSLNKIISLPTSGTDPGSGMLGLFAFTPTCNIDVFVYRAEEVTKYNTGVALNIDSLMGWQWRIQGQLWDSFQQTKADTLDQTPTFTDYDTDDKPLVLPCKIWSSSFYQSLVLMTGNAQGSPQPWNTAY